jgi:hypothetical protein
MRCELFEYKDDSSNPPDWNFVFVGIHRSRDAPNEVKSGVEEYPDRTAGRGASEGSITSSRMK